MNIFYTVDINCKFADVGKLEIDQNRSQLKTKLYKTYSKKILSKSFAKKTFKSFKYRLKSK